MDEMIELTGWEMLLAAQAGCMRQVENLKKNRNHRHGASASNTWQMGVEGCLGEFALAKYLGVYWSGKGVLRAPDVGDVDVRTSSKPHYRLILHPDDPDDRKFYLLTGLDGKYIVRGWIMGIDGKQDQYWEDPAGGRPAYFVPQSALQL